MFCPSYPQYRRQTLSWKRSDASMITQLTWPKFFEEQRLSFKGTKKDKKKLKKQRKKESEENKEGKKEERRGVRLYSYVSIHGY